LVAAGEDAARPFRPLVAFDFDGTLTWRDSFRAFLAWHCGRRRYAQGLACLIPAAAAWTRDKDRGALKAAMLREFLAGARQSDLAAAAERFAAQAAPRLLRPDALRAWRRWREADARLVIVTASPEILVAPFGRGLGAEAVIGTRLSVSPEGFITGALNGPNCRGPEKVVRLEAAYGQGVRLEAAYGDSDGDTAMLAISDQPGMKVFGERP
jgi:phosphatidylglycerophosphatase C